METSFFLAKLIGLYMLISSFALLLHSGSAKKVMNNFVKNHLTVFFTAEIELLVGLMIVLSHNLWQANWTILITLIGWACIFEACFFLFCPQTGEKLIKALNRPKWFVTWGILGIVFGLVLAYAGFVKLMY